MLILFFHSQISTFRACFAPFNSLEAHSGVSKA